MTDPRIITNGGPLVDAVFEENISEDPGLLGSAAEAAGQTNPLVLVGQCMKLLRRLEQQGELHYRLHQRVAERMLRGSLEMDTWRVFPIRYTAATDLVKSYEFTNGQNIRYIYISTAELTTPGRFYMSLNEALMLQGAALAPTWDFVGKIGSESLKFPVPRGAPKIWLYGTQDFEATVYTATAKSALPS